MPPSRTLPSIRSVGAALATWHPIALASSYVLISFSATPLPPSALTRPLLIAVGATVLLQAALWIALRRRHAASLIAGTVVLVSSAAWLPLGLAAALACWWLIVSWRRRARGAPLLRLSLDRIAQVFGGVVWVMVVVAVAPVIGIFMTAGESADTGRLRQTDEADRDIVVVILDGYPRADALLRMGGDNAGFLQSLGDRGFSTATEARANYTSTWATLASMLHGAYLTDIERLAAPYPDGAAEQYRALMELIREAPLLQPFRDRGFEIVTMPPTLEGAQLTAADRVVSAPQMTAFELSLIQRSPLGNLVLRASPSIAYGQHRARTEDTLRMTAEEMEVETDHPRFVVSHVTSPHAPMVADASGDDVAPPPCFPDCSMYVFGSQRDWDRLPGHVAHLNDLVLDMVDSIIASQPDATIVLMSDHGMRMPAGDEADLFRSLFTIRAPMGDPDVPDDVQPWQVLRILAGDDPGSAPYRAWISADERPLDLTPYAGPVP